ncbi:MAG: M14 family metallopeptidase, partial [Planctomycetes bacterium]|nr:M14 family metallopeptidase [Planctomycetota bacterium]
ANIHAGEVEGKEAVQMLARDMLLGDKQTFLEGLIVLITPIFNSDGNEKLGHNRRDKGPELAGVRHNGLMLDLNRDGIKLESPEVKAMVSTILNQWDPALFVDCHTTNGSYHDEPVTYGWPLNPNGDGDIIRFMRDDMMPRVDQDLEQSYKTLSIPYGNFVDPHQPEKGWVSSDPQGRYLTNYVGLRNRLSILLENYSYADFKARVWGNYHFLLSVLQYCQENRGAIKTLLAEADQRVVLKGLNPAQAGGFGLDYAQKALGRTVDILGYEHDPYTDARGRKRVRKTDTKRVYTCPLLYDWTLKRTVRRPPGYVVTVNDPWVVANLKQHGLLVERLKESVELTVESFTP